MTQIFLWILLLSAFLAIIVACFGIWIFWGNLQKLLSKTAANKKPKIILIAGGSGSGKTYIAKQLKAILEKRTKARVLYLSLDNYYKTIDRFSEQKVEDVNWDQPEAFNWKLLQSDLNNDKKIKRPVYIFETATLSKNHFFEIYPSDIIIIEGLYAFNNEAINKLADYKIFVTTSEKIRFERRIERDKKQRHLKTFNQEKLTSKWNNQIEPMYKKFVAPQAKLSNIKIHNNYSAKKPIDITKTKEFEEIIAFLSN